MFANFEMYVEPLQGRQLITPSGLIVKDHTHTHTHMPTHTHTHTHTGPDNMLESTMMQVYVRHWHPSTYTVDATQEIILNETSPAHLKEKVCVWGGGWGGGCV